MAKSYVEQTMETMHQLLWKNFLRQWVEGTLWLIPWIGPFLKAAMAFPPIDAIVMFLIETFLEKPLFLIMARWGVFTSIDWQEAKIYDAYEREAQKLIAQQGAPTWDPTDRENFRNAARSLIHFNLRLAS